MKWYVHLKDLKGNEHDVPMHEYHEYSNEACEVTGVCGIAEAEDTLRMALELALEGRTTAKVSSSYYNGHFYEFGKGHSYCGWWGIE